MSRLLLLLVATFCCSFVNAAVVRYSYQGPDLQASGGSIGQPPLGPAGLTAISGYIDFGEALAADLDAETVAGVLSYEFFDGVTVVDESNSYLEDLEVSTDSFGNLTAWLLTMPQSAPGTEIDSPESMIVSSSDSGSANFPRFDSVIYAAGLACVGTECFPTSVSVRTTSAGQWSAAVVPVPAGFWLFTSALGLLGWTRRRMA